MTNLPVPDEWQIWIAENLQRGCTQVSLLQIMVNNKFDRTSSQTAIAVVAEKLKQTTLQPPANQKYIYQQARIADGNSLHVQGKTVRVAASVKQPVIVLMDDFLTAVECDELIRLTKQKLQPSNVVDPVSGDFTVVMV